MTKCDVRLFCFFTSPSPSPSRFTSDHTLSLRVSLSSTGEPTGKMAHLLQRSPLHELSNDYAISAPASPTFSSPIPTRPRKRQRITDQENEETLLRAFDKPQNKSIPAEEEDHAEVQEIVPRKQHASTFARLHAAALSTRRLPFHRRKPTQAVQHCKSLTTCP